MLGSQAVVAVFSVLSLSSCCFAVSFCRRSPFVGCHSCCLDLLPGVELSCNAIKASSIQNGVHALDKQCRWPDVECCDPVHKLMMNSVPLLSTCLQS